MRSTIHLTQKEDSETLIDRGTLWICKPANGSLGKEITIHSDVQETISRWNDCQDQALLVQRYVRPFLISNRKWDMRIFVVVTAFLSEDHFEPFCDASVCLPPRKEERESDGEDCGSFVMFSSEDEEMEEQVDEWTCNQDVKCNQTIKETKFPGVCLKDEPQMFDRSSFEAKRDTEGEKMPKGRFKKRIEQSVWMYRKGIARFCTQEYDLENLWNKKAHITNSSVNIRHKETEESMSDVSHVLKAKGSAPKWDLKNVVDHLIECGMIRNESVFWKAIDSIVRRTMEPLLSSFGVQWSTLSTGVRNDDLGASEHLCGTNINNNNNNNNINLCVPCQQFEILGFDIMLSDTPQINGNPDQTHGVNSDPDLLSLEERLFLLEVNGYPSLSCDCAVDLEVKHPLINDVSDLLVSHRFLNPSSRPTQSSASVLLETLLSDQQETTCGSSPFSDLERWTNTMNEMKERCDEEQSFCLNRIGGLERLLSMHSDVS